LWCGKDLSLRHEGPRKMVSLRRHGGKRRGVGPAFFASHPGRRAGRACAAHKGQEMADPSASSAGMDTVRKETPSVRFAMEREADEKTERPMPETGEQHPRFLSSQRDWSRGHKALNGALKGATSNNHSGQLPAPRPMLFDKPRARSPRGQRYFRREAVHASVDHAFMRTRGP